MTSIGRVRREDRPRSYVARMWSADGKPLVGKSGDAEWQSAPHSHAEDAQVLVDTGVEISAKLGRSVMGEVVSSREPAKFKRHCPGSPPGIIGSVCPGCSQVIS